MNSMFKMLLGLTLSSFSFSVWALNIVATIPPVGSLALPFLSQGDQVTVILTPGQSPHGFQMRPSHRMQLEKADIILAVGTGVDAWANKVLQASPEKVIWMQKLPGLVKFSQRNDEKWPKHAHKAPALAEHDHDHDHDHDTHHGQPEAEAPQGYFQDPHIWLSPENGLLMGRAIALRLMTLQPDRVDTLQQQLKLWEQDLKVLDAQMATQLKAVQAQPYLVLHDAFQYFEKHYQLNGVGAIQINPELKPSLKKVLALREQIKHDGVVCVFKEPQFPEKQVLYVIEDLPVHVGQLDPLGRQAQLMPYHQLLQNLAESFQSCLRQADVQNASPALPLN